MEIAVGFNSLTTTTHPPNVNLPSSGQHVTARLSARKVSVAEGNRAQDPLVRETTARLAKTMYIGSKTSAELREQYWKSYNYIKQEGNYAVSMNIRTVSCCRG